MKMHKNFFPLTVAIIVIATNFVLVPQTVYANSNACTDPTGMPIPCPDNGGNKPGPKNRPTAVIPNPTSALAPTPVPTAAQDYIPITGGGAGSTDPGALLPAVQKPSQGASSFPGPLGMIIAVLIIVVCFGGGFFFLRYFRKAGETNAGFGDGSVRIADSSDKFIKITNPSSQFDKTSDAAKQLAKIEDDGFLQGGQSKPGGD